MASSAENTQKFLEAQAGFDKPFSPTHLTGLAVFRWEGSDQAVPVRLRTGPKPCGDPFEKKWFSSVELNGDRGGWFTCRIWVDGVIVVDGAAGSFAEIPGRPRSVRIPRGTKGYHIDIEVVYTGKLRGIEVNYDTMARPGK